MRNSPKNPPSKVERQILLQLGMLELIPQGLDRKVMKMNTKQDYWHPPPQGFLKFNIDGASKGNPSVAGFGGVLRDDYGCILSIFHCHLGRATNNLAELMALEHCLEFLKQNNLQNIIVEVDFELIINSVKRISYGTEPEKVSKQWRLLQFFHRIQLHLRGLNKVGFTHVLRATNKLADILANQGVLYTMSRVELSWQEMPQNGLRVHCLDQADEDRKVFCREVPFGKQFTVGLRNHGKNILRSV